MRSLGIDLGARKVGLAISDASGILARPMQTLRVNGFASAGIQTVIKTIEKLQQEPDGLGTVIVGLPGHLNGTASKETELVLQVVEELRARLRIPVMVRDERLSSREAESRLAMRERAWRKRKPKLDAAAAAVVLQDYLDSTTSE